MLLIDTLNTPYRLTLNSIWLAIGIYKNLAARWTGHGVLAAAVLLFVWTSSARANQYHCEEFIDDEWRDCGGVAEDLDEGPYIEPIHDLVTWVPVCEGDCGVDHGGAKRAPSGGIRQGHVLTRCGKYGYDLSDASQRGSGAFAGIPEPVPNPIGGGPRYKVGVGIKVQLDPGLGSIASLQWAAAVRSDPGSLIGADPDYQFLITAAPLSAAPYTPIFQTRKGFPVRYPGTYRGKAYVIEVVTSRLNTCFPAVPNASLPFRSVTIAP